MSRATNAITIDRSIEDVFAVMINVENLGRWFPADVEEHWTTPPPVGVGSTRKAVIRILGRRFENEAVVTVFDPPRRGAIRGTSRYAPFNATLDFAPVDGGTRVEVTTEITLGRLGRPVAALMSWSYGRRWARGLATLKRMMESGEL